MRSLAGEWGNRTGLRTQYTVSDPIQFTPLYNSLWDSSLVVLALDSCLWGSLLWLSSLGPYKAMWYRCPVFKTGVLPAQCLTVSEGWTQQPPDGNDRCCSSRSFSATIWDDKRIGIF